MQDHNQDTIWGSPYSWIYCWPVWCPQIQPPFHLFVHHQMAHNWLHQPQHSLLTVMQQVHKMFLNIFSTSWHWCRTQHFWSIIWCSVLAPCPRLKSPLLGSQQVSNSFIALIPAAHLTWVQMQLIRMPTRNPVGLTTDLEKEAFNITLGKIMAKQKKWSFHCDQRIAIWP